MEMSAARIRTARLEDAPSLAALLRALGWFAELEEEPRESTERRVRRHLSACLADNSHSVYVAEAEERVIGYAAVHWLPCLFLPGPEGYVCELFVEEAYRGRGVGRSLLEVIVAEAHGRGCARLMLLTDRDREAYRRGFYTKGGWTEHPELAHFILRLG
jgi:GNAT superfamily N-acetyltransferase